MYLTGPLLMDVQVISILHRHVFNKFYPSSFCCRSAYLKGQWFCSLATLPSHSTFLTHHRLQLQVVSRGTS